jgi:hypothetical protein
MNRSYFYYALLLTVFCLSATNAAAGGDYEFCQDYDNYITDGKRAVSQKDLREVTVPATRLIEVDGQKNGGISVKGENRSDVFVRACVRTWAESEQDALVTLNNTRIETSGVIRAVNADSAAKYSVSYELLVPLQTNLKLSAHNGGISISSVDGNLRFETKNGGVSLRDVAGDVQGTTQNGGVSVKLSGPTFRGTGLDVETKNGGVNLVLPKTFAGDIETGTVNGGFKSDFPELNIERDDKQSWTRPKKISASLNGGGAKIRVVTTNGGVKIGQGE